MTDDFIEAGSNQEIRGPIIEVTHAVLSLISDTLYEVQRFLSFSSEMMLMRYESIPETDEEDRRVVRSVITDFDKLRDLVKSINELLSKSLQASERMDSETERVLISLTSDIREIAFSKAKPKYLN